MELTANIPYHEHQIISKLRDAHLQELGNSLRAILAFGQLITGQAAPVHQLVSSSSPSSSSSAPPNGWSVPDGLDIELLEIVSGWDGPLLLTSYSTQDLLLRGELRLYFLTPDQLEDAEVNVKSEDLRWAKDLIKRVREGYVVLYQAQGYQLPDSVDNRPISAMSPPATGSAVIANPLRPTELRGLASLKADGQVTTESTAAMKKKAG